MAKRTDMSKMYVRSTPEARHALRRLLADVSSPALLGEVFQEDFVAATWLWLRTMDPAAVAEGVGPFVRQFEAFFSDDGPPATDLDASGRPIPTQDVDRGGSVGRPYDPATGRPLGKTPKRGKTA